jgi:hypothetical protein
MTPARAGSWLLLTTMLAAPLASATPRAKARSASQASAAATERSHAVTLRSALQRHLSNAGLTDSFAAYGISPSITQLRRYVESKRLKLICIVDLSIQDEQGNLLTTVRGSATTTGASPEEAIDAATHAAVVRLPQAVQALRANSPKSQVADARRQWELPLR